MDCTKQAAMQEMSKTLTQFNLQDMTTDMMEMIRDIDVDKSTKLDEEIPIELEGDKQSIEELKSDPYFKETQEYDELVETVNNDYTKMSALLDKLIELDPKEVSQEKASSLKDTLGSFVTQGGEFLKEMKIYLSQNADITSGKINIDSKELYLNVGNGTSNMSLGEVFVHEVVHAATAYAIEDNATDAASTIGRLHDLYQDVIRATTKDEWVEAFEESGMDEETANNTYEYIFVNSENGLHEFIAHGLTNDVVIDKLKTMEVYKDRTDADNWFQRLVDLFSNLMDNVFSRFRGEQGIKADKLLLKLTVELAQANNKAANIAREDLGAKFYDQADKLEEFLVDMIDRAEGIFDKATMPKHPGKDASKIELAKWAIKVLGVGVFTSKENKKDFYDLLRGGGFKANQLLQVIIRGLSERDETFKHFELLALGVNNIDQVKNERRASINKAVSLGFKEKLSSLEDEAVGMMVIENDLQSIWEDYDHNTLMKLIEDPKELEKEIKRKKKELQGKGTGYYINQAKGLGWYMVTGTVNKAVGNQMLNAQNINNRLGTAEAQIDVLPENEKVIDQLATLYAIQYTKPKVRELFLDVLKKDPEGIKSSVALHYTFVTESKDRMFDKEDIASNMIKGYSKDRYDQDVTLELGFAEDEEAMNARGFKKVKALGTDPYDTAVEGLYLYKSTDHVTQRYVRKAVRLTDARSKGTSIRSKYYSFETAEPEVESARAISKIIKQNDRIYQRIKENEITLDPKNVGLVPIVNSYGEVIDYRYQMSKRDRFEYLRKSNAIGTGLGRLFESMEDKVRTRTSNRYIIDQILEESENMKDHPREYWKIGINSSDTESRELWKLLPSDLRNYIKHKTNNDYIYVREDMKDLMFGFRKYSIDNNKLIKQAYPHIRHLIRVIEQHWQNIISLFKIDIVIKTPAVLIGNIISNVMISLMRGMSPKEVLKYQTEAAVELTKYKKAEHRKDLLLAQIDAKQLSKAKIQQARAEIAAIENKLKKSPIRPLIDAGLFQAIVEDVALDSVSEDSKIIQAIKDRVEGLPPVLREGSKYLWMTKETPMFKMMMTFTQYSDFVARYAMYKTGVEKMKRKGVDSKTAHDKQLRVALDTFVNYELPDGSMLQYLNDMGLVMFTKYFMQAQNIVRNNFKEKPLHTMMMLGLQAISGVDVEDPYDSSFIVKDMSNMVHNPLEALAELWKPSGLQFVDDLIR